MIADNDTKKFLREDLRPLCELGREFITRSANLELQWFAVNGIASKVNNDAIIVDDERLITESVVALRGDQIHGIMSILIGMKAAGHLGILQDGCVRALEVS